MLSQDGNKTISRKMQSRQGYLGIGKQWQEIDEEEAVALLKKIG
jgi:hypothetical protein